MADLKKYVDQAAAQRMVTNIKAEDVKTLEAAKAYADGLATNYETAGAAATAEANAKQYADDLAANLETKGEAAKVQANLDKEVERATNAETDLQAAIDAVDEKADKNAEDIAAINNEETGILAKSKAHTDTEIAKVQGNVEALDEKVGDLPEGTTATSVVDYVNIKTSGIATDAALGELNSQVAGLQEAVQGLQNDHLVEADKEELQGGIDAANDRIDEVSGKVTTLIGEDENKSVRTIANEELAKQLIPEGAKESLDTLTELAAWIQAHPDDASAMNRAIEELKTLVGTIPEGVTATTIVAYIQEVVAAEQARAEGVEAGFETRIKALEDKTGTGEGSVTEQIETAKEEAIAAAAEDATTKANTAEENAKKHADDLNTAMDARMDEVEADQHTHENKDVIDGITAEKVAAWDGAATNNHTHENATELAKIADGDVAKWNAAEQNAKDHADSLNTAMTAKVDGIDARVTQNTTDIGLKAAQSDLTALAERVTANEGNIAANASAIAALQPLTVDDIDAMFA